MTKTMREILGYFDANGMNTRGGDVINQALGKANASELDRLEAYIASRGPRERSALGRWLGGAIAGERRYRDRLAGVNV